MTYMYIMFTGYLRLCASIYNSYRRISRWAIRNHVRMHVCDRITCTWVVDKPHAIRVSTRKITRTMTPIALFGKRFKNRLQDVVALRRVLFFLFLRLLIAYLKLHFFRWAPIPHRTYGPSIPYSLS